MAVEAHKAGKLQDAEALYRAILQIQPKHPDANHNLGVIAVSINKTETALPLFKTALEANPNQGQFWLSYVDALIKEKQFDNAKNVFEQGKNLQIPEIVPFRLTRDVVDGMGISGFEGTFRRSCEEVLRVLRENSTQLLTILEVVIHDPLYKWSLSPLQARQKQQKGTIDKTLLALAEGDGKEKEEKIINKMKEIHKELLEKKKSKKALKVLKSPKINIGSSNIEDSNVDYPEQY
jgi:tetratricopeptide (TPR) repeat protein